MKPSRVSPLLALAARLALSAAVAARIDGGAFGSLTAVPTWREGEVSHLYRFPLLAGQFVRIAAEQRSSDVFLEVLAPGSAEPTEIDGRTYATGADAFELIAKISGEARVRVVLGEAIGDAPGYRLTISAPHRPTARESASAAAFADFEESRALPAEQAIPRLERALRWAAQAREGDLSARIHDRFGRLLPADDPEGLRHFRAAAALAQEPQLAGMQLHKLGLVFAGLQRFDEAAVAYQAEHRLAQRSRDRFREALALEGLAALAKLRGGFGEALARERQALAIWRQLGDRMHQAQTRQILSGVSADLGDHEQAAADAKEGLALGPPPAQRVDLLDLLALAYRNMKDWDRARAISTQAIAAARRLGDRDKEASCLLTAGAIELDRWRIREALVYLKPAEEILLHEVDHPAYLANVEVMLGAADTHNGDLGQAFKRFARSLEGYRRLGDRSAWAFVISRRSDALRQAGRFEEARADLEQAISILESLRPGLEPQARANLLANRHRFFERLVDLLVEQKKFSAAFEASERSRARTLLDEVSGRPVTPPRSLAEIQAALSPGYVLLDYWLGETRSFVWAVRREGLSLATLPTQEVIEGQSRQAARALGVPPGRLTTRDRSISVLARTLFGGIAGRLSGERFVIVPDGELFNVPFAALPIPGPADAAPERTPERLIDRGAVVTLPSASLALEIRDAVARRPAADGLFAVGDPVFGCPDDRLACKAPAVVRPSLLERLRGWAQARFRPPVPRERDATAGELPRISRTRSEVEAIARLAGAGEVTERLDFAASRSAVLGSPLESFRILHFATHGLVDPARPARSGLALARRDPKGARLAGDPFFRLGDLAGRRLRADLVVLSACDTALGRQTRGEGPQSLGRAFLAAGAGNALVSLWRVDDSSTEELMVGFYRQLLERGLPAAAALRQSQLAVRSRAEWSDPYYWGAFVLQGDWRDDDREAEKRANETNRRVSSENVMSRAAEPRRLR